MKIFAPFKLQIPNLKGYILKSKIFHDYVLKFMSFLLRNRNSPFF